MSLFDKIMDLVRENNMTVSELERDLNLGNGTIKRWILSSPSCDKILRVSDYFEVSLDYLLRDDLENNLKKVDDEDFEIFRGIKSLTKKQKAVIMGKIYEYEEINEADSKTTLFDIKDIKEINKLLENENYENLLAYARSYTDAPATKLVLTRDQLERINNANPITSEEDL